jgi:hypothetical protein
MVVTAILPEGHMDLGPGKPATTRPVRQPSVVDAIVPMVALAFLIAASLALFGLDALDGPIQVVPWNSCGAFMSAVLGVPTLSYLPHAVFNYASPALSVLYGVTGFKVEKVALAGSPSKPESPPR